MLLIGDVHALFSNYKEIIKRSGKKKSLQLGDYGLGFPDTMGGIDLSDVEGTHQFLRGNHDNPAVCSASPYYIGDYGICSGDFIDGRYDSLFYLSGAWSIDKAYRTVGISWWEAEELSYSELLMAIKCFEENKPEIVCSHDCPNRVLKQLYPGRYLPTRTSDAMESMLEIHEPSYWFFGHHHVSKRIKIGNTLFVCLNELETLDISKPIFLR